MYTVTNMAYSDIEVFRVLRQLVSERGEGAVITQRSMSEISGIPIITLQRSLRRLACSRQIERTFTPRIGCTYRIVNGSTPDAKP